MTWAKGYVSLILSTRCDPKPEPVPPVRLWTTIVPCGGNNRYILQGAVSRCSSLTLVCFPLDRGVRIWALVGEYVVLLDKALYSQCLSPPRRMYPTMDKYPIPIQGGVEILLVTSCTGLIGHLAHMKTLCTCTNGGHIMAFKRVNL